MREDEATAGASDEREVEELDMELVVNHERIAYVRYAQECNVLGRAQRSGREQGALRGSSTLVTPWRMSWDPNIDHIHSKTTSFPMA